jgi:hypothetical protein
MKNLLTVCVLMFGFSMTASADIWKWVDANGKTHFVDTMTPIYTWIDELGKIHYSDTPDHEDAVSVQLVWHSTGSLDPGETAEQRAEREKAEAYYCKRATEIYDSYVNAPQLYRTDANGEREYLSKEEAAKTIAETRAKKDAICG